ncbi:MAG: hypothetical protein COV73_03415, partial [Candidatus Omnitrophica bacterium CG11_big_fil_rev_8_21_14_0_20_43_6]
CGKKSEEPPLPEEPKKLLAPAKIGDALVMLNWVNQNISSKGLPLSFQVLSEDVWPKTVNEHQRMVLKKGLVIYDGALAQILWAMSQDKEKADRLINLYWEDNLRGYQTIRASNSGNKTQPFIYRNPNDTPVSEKDKRGYIFKIIDVDGQWEDEDVLTGTKKRWEQWQPISGENAWAGVIGPLQAYFQAHPDKEYSSQDVELRLAEEIARAAMLLQADNGGIRYAPKGTWHENDPEQSNPFKEEWAYNEQSTENNLSWYAAFKMLSEITKKQQYQQALQAIEKYLESVYRPQEGYFMQGMHYINGQWLLNEGFASDCQTWAILSLGPEKIDELFGQGATYKLWQKTKEEAGVSGAAVEITGIDFTNYRRLGREAMVSYEWTGGAILAVKAAADYYANTAKKDFAQELTKDALSMKEYAKAAAIRQDDWAAWPYASNKENAPTGFGWYAPPAPNLSLASTVWMAFVELGFNPFVLGGGPQDILHNELGHTEIYNKEIKQVFMFTGGGFGAGARPQQDKDTVSKNEDNLAKAVLDYQEWENKYGAKAMPYEKRLRKIYELFAEHRVRGPPHLEQIYVFIGEPFDMPVLQLLKFYPEFPALSLRERNEYLVKFFKADEWSIRQKKLLRQITFAPYFKFSGNVPYEARAYLAQLAETGYLGTGVVSALGGIGVKFIGNGSGEEDKIARMKPEEVSGYYEPKTNLELYDTLSEIFGQPWQYYQELDEKSEGTSWAMYHSHMQYEELRESVFGLDAQTYQLKFGAKVLNIILDKTESRKSPERFLPDEFGAYNGCSIYEPKENKESLDNSSLEEGPGQLSLLGDEGLSPIQVIIGVLIL